MGYFQALALALLGRLEVLDDGEDLRADVDALRESLYDAIEENERLRATVKEQSGDLMASLKGAAQSLEIVNCRLKDAMTEVEILAESIDS